MKRNIQVVGLCGYARAGKDTAARALIDLGWSRLGFADALKGDLHWLMCACAKRAKLDRALTPQYAWFGDPQRKEALRPLMVAYGAAMRSVDPDVWVKRAEMSMATGGGRVVITDVRYANECAMIHRHNGIVIQVRRPGCGPANPEEKRSFAEIENTPGSIDAFVPNSESVELLHDRILKIVKHSFK